jgi:hypothetical protein
MVFKKRLAYQLLAAVLVIATTWGCSSDPPPKPPPEVEKAVEEGGTELPVIEGGVEDATEETPGNSKESTKGEKPAENEDEEGEEDEKEKCVAQPWATLKGRFVYDGKAPAVVKLNVNKDPVVCTKIHPIDEVITVGEDGGLAHVIVWVRTKEIDIHPDYAKGDPPVVTLDNLNCKFTPHVAAVRTGQVLELGNSDPIGHNSLGTCRENPPFNDNIPPGAKLPKKFEKAERLPFPVACGSHPWMKSYVLVQDHPYMSVSALDGSFELANLPAGVDLEFQVWHETGYIQEVTKDGAKTAWKRGRFEVKLENGQELNLGNLLVDPDELK